MLSVPAPVLAASGPVEVIDMVWDKVSQSYVATASNLSNWTSAELVALETRAAQVAAKGAALGITTEEAGGLLTRFAQGMKLGSGAGGIWGMLLSGGLMLGLSWALSSGTISTDSAGLHSATTPGACSTLSAPPGSITNVGTGTYKSSSTQQTSYFTEYVSNPSGGTVPSPMAGWSWTYQASPGSNGLTQVVFSKGPETCGTAVVYPATTGVATGNNLTTQQKAEVITPRVMADTVNALSQVKVANVANDPGDKYDLGVATTSMVPSIPSSATIGTMTNPVVATQPTITFDPSDPNFPGTATDPGTGTGGNSSEPEGNVSVDWGTPPPDVALPSVTPMSWFPNPFSAPTLSMQCVPFTGTVKTLGTITVDPCPYMPTVAQYARPLCMIGATIAAGKILLEV